MPIQEQIQLNFVPPSVSLFLVHREATSQLEFTALKQTFQSKVDEEAILVEDFAETTRSDEESQAPPPWEALEADLNLSNPSTFLAVQIVPCGAIHAALQPTNGAQLSRTACGRDIPKSFKCIEDLLVSPLCRRSGCRQAFQIISYFFCKRVFPEVHILILILQVRRHLQGDCDLPRHHPCCLRLD